MPKILNYPNASFEKSLEVAKATFELGGNCNEETCAEKLGRKVSGGFKAIIATAQKFGLIEYSKGDIEVTHEYELIEHAYTESEKYDALIKAFLQPQVFEDLFKRFEGKKLPVELLNRMLIREYEVDSKRASRVAKYFTDGLEFLNLIDSSNHFKSLDNLNENELIEEKNEDNDSFEEVNSQKENSESVDNLNENKFSQKSSSTKFIVQLIGPGMNSSIEINDEDDLIIVDATLNKIRKKIKEMEGNS